MNATRDLAVVILGFLAFATALLGLLSLWPKTSATARGLWPQLISEVVVVAIVLVAVVPGGAVTALAATLLAGRCGWEAATVVLGDAARRRAVAVGLATGLAAGLAAFGGWVGVAVAIVPTIAVVAAAAGLGRPGGLADGLRLLLHPVTPLVAFGLVAGSAGGGAVLLLAFLLVETMDSAAVLGGRLYGRHKAFPRLSPRKTVEGLATGAAAVVIATFVLSFAVPGGSAGRLAAMAAAVAVATVAGDLAASAVKRRAGVKDYPIVHPTQGGVLDVVDAWIVAAPVLALVAAAA
ncbi:MAG: phosphatidate cytidylyltransferase [Phyllobacteriaceae bacterium]|nr:phosphatidate cytidylyltransferase [Phyllobacteriaceae bacterium]